MFLKCPDNTIIADFVPCAYLCGHSGVAREPYMAWRSISQSRSDYSLKPCTMGI